MAERPGVGLSRRNFGRVAEWLGKGLQNPLQGFNSPPDLIEDIDLILTRVV